MIKKCQPKNQPGAYTKAQLMRSEKYSRIQQDVMSALLGDEEKYSLRQVDQIIEKFKQQEVK